MTNRGIAKAQANSATCLTALGTVQASLSWADCTSTITNACTYPDVIDYDLEIVCNCKQVQEHKSETYRQGGIEMIVKEALFSSAALVQPSFQNCLVHLYVERLDDTHEVAGLQGDLIQPLPLLCI